MAGKVCVFGGQASKRYGRAGGSDEVSGVHAGGPRRQSRGGARSSGIRTLRDFVRTTAPGGRKERNSDPSRDAHSATCADPGATRRTGDRVGDFCRDHAGVRGRGARVLAARQTARGALRESYDIPEVTFRGNQDRGLLLTSMLVAGWVSWHLGYQARVMVACAAPSTVFRALSFLLSWFDKPATATPAGRARLDRLHVTVAVPVYNEDPGLLDRCVFAIIN